MGRAHQEGSRGWFRRAVKRVLGLKGVGAATAVVSLILSLYALFSLLSGFLERRRQVAELVAIATAQLRARDYAASLATLDSASRAAGRDPRVRATQEDVAMEWLEHVHVLGDKRFSDVVDPLVPILDRGALTASGPRKADLIAHRGWADFLRSRDVGVEAHPAAFYRDALAVDAGNPYANAMWAHWILWQRRGAGLDSAKALFATAIAAARARGFVRDLQLAGLMDRARGRDDVDAAVEMIRALDDARKNGEEIEAHIHARAFATVYRRPPTEAERVLTALPPVEHLATYRWLFERPDYAPSDSLRSQYVLARLEDAAGERDNALRTYRWVASNLPRCGFDCPSAADIQAAIRRLSAAP